MQLSRQGIDLSKFLTKDLVDNMRENAKPEAVERLNRTLALGEIAKQESLAVTDEEVKTRSEEMMADVDDPSQVDPERLNQVVNEDLLKEKILGWLKENSNIELVPEGTLTPDEEEDDTAAEGEVAVSADGTVDVESVEVSEEAAEAESVEAEEVKETKEPEAKEAKPAKADGEEKTSKAKSKKPKSESKKSDAKKSADKKSEGKKSGAKKPKGKK